MCRNVKKIEKINVFRLTEQKACELVKSICR